MDRNLQHLITQWMETDREARLIVGDDLKPIWVSAAAERMLSQPDSILYCNGRLRPRSPNVDNELRAFVSEATNAGATHCLTDSRTGQHMVLSTTRLNDLVAITLHRPEHSAPIRLVDLRQAFGLTDAEHSVAEHLMNGHTAEETAAQLGVGIETIRTHIKRTYAKLDVSSREALFNRLRSFVSETSEAASAAPRNRRARRAAASPAVAVR
jgi:DNA-binding CsgD family transcriptional regulator